MRSTTGAQLGVLTLDRTTSGVRVRGTLTKLPAGAHGIHFHQAGRCHAPDFESAGAHVNPTNTQHGLENPQGPHAGDLPNVVVSAAGQVSIDLTSARVSLDQGGPGWLLDADGSTVIIHQNADDQRTDPSGNSGARIACGVVQRGTGTP
jgi:Cu-Zn family superoxide dismutase